jgi:3-methyladenine DNA glycosylase/8-oxoguanine DNA glycosylase
MRRLSMIGCIGGAAFAVAACATSYPLPNDQYAAAEKQVGRAQASSADANPNAKLYLQLAQEDLAKAKALMNEDNKRARTLIERADAEADLAASLARSAQAQSEAQAVTEQLTKLKGQ